MPRNATLRSQRPRAVLPLKPQDDARRSEARNRFVPVCFEIILNVFSDENRSSFNVSAQCRLLPHRLLSFCTLPSPHPARPILKLCRTRWTIFSTSYLSATRPAVDNWFMNHDRFHRPRSVLSGFCSQQLLTVFSKYSKRRVWRNDKTHSKNKNKLSLGLTLKLYQISELYTTSCRSVLI